MVNTFIEALNLNSTFFIQFLIFLSMYPILSRLLIGPYFKVYLLREKKTKNLMQEAEKWQKNQEILKEEYVKKAQQINRDFQQIFLQQSRQINEEFSQKKQMKVERIQKEQTTRFQNLDVELQQIRNQTAKQIKPLAEQAFHRLIS